MPFQTNSHSILKIICQLEHGLKVQENSATLMHFLVQDLLDYAQIKSKKFRKNIKTFDIRDAIEKVMSIQRRKAQEKDLSFFSEYIEMEEEDFIIESDEQRIMQVLLGI